MQYNWQTTRMYLLNMYNISDLIMSWHSTQQEEQNEARDIGAKNEYSTSLATLAVIGGVDKRLRLGGQVQHEEFGLGTVAKIATSGKILVQAHDGLGGVRQCRIGELEVVSMIVYVRCRALSLVLIF